MRQKNRRLSQSFQRRLLVSVLCAFLVSTALLWVAQTQLFIHNATSLLSINISDVRQDIVDATDEHLISLAWQIAQDLDKEPEVTSGLLVDLVRRYNVSELNYVDETGIIQASTYPQFLQYDMASGEQSKEFLSLLSGESEHVQAYGPVSYDASISRKYGGVTLSRGGFIQVGYDSHRFRQDIDAFVVGITRNRHVGVSGSLIILDEHWEIVSDRHGYEGKNLAVTGVYVDPDSIAPGQMFVSSVYGTDCYCMYQASEGYTILAAIPKQEAALSRNISIGMIIGMEVAALASLSVLIYLLVKRLIVNNIQHINDSLSQITQGDLDVSVDVRSHQEFSSLSDGINSTVSTMKRYIAEADARIDAELAFAKAIQHSVLPSVFPPFPEHREIDIWASMHMARDVGGDFYDFYFVNDHTLAFLVADVSSKGIPAAMFMMTSRTLLKSCAEMGNEPQEVLAMANNKLCEGNEAGMFVTVWLGMLDVRTGKLTYANAGHTAPILKHGGNGFESLHGRSGFVLAGMTGTRYRKGEILLAPGDMIYLHTDGVTGVPNSKGEQYGEERLLTLLNSMKEASPQQICESVKADVDAFMGNEPQFDDITMVCLKYTGPAGS